MRQTARKLKINHKTVVRKFLFLGEYSLKMIPVVNTLYPRSKVVEFDDLETFEHTKCKPLSVTIAVEYKTRRILGFRVSVMPAKGHLAEASRKKYGRRKDERKAQRRALFSELKPFIQEGALIKSDENPHYQPDVKEFFPGCEYRTYPGQRGCVTGQGELKRGGFDPLFTLNHTYAMIRDHIKRLSRRTWCTTKKKGSLALHMALYVHYHNLVLTRKKKKGPLQLGPFASSTI